MRFIVEFPMPAVEQRLLLWERLWNPFRPRDGQSVFTRTPRQRIDWRNYYDLGDPVGFQLDTAYEFLRECGCKAFEFPASHDMGFARYPLPGKAHDDKLRMPDGVHQADAIHEWRVVIVYANSGPAMLFDLRGDDLVLSVQTASPKSYMIES